MKKLLPLLILALIIPQVALAAWWNPFSWFGNDVEQTEVQQEVKEKLPCSEDDPIGLSADCESITTDNPDDPLDILKDEETVTNKSAWWNPFSWNFNRTNKEKEALEEKVKELEEKLDEVESATSTSVVNKEKESSTAVTSKATSNSTLKPVVPVQTQTQNTANISVDELITKYTSFRDYVASEKSGLIKNSSLYSERNYYSYLEELLNRISADLGYLSTIKHWKQLPENIEQTYLYKFNKLETEHKSEATTYAVEREQNEISLAKQTAIDYIEINKYQLYETDIHVRAAQVLYLFDKLFSTNYAKEFELKKTQQETLEFANRFLIDQRY